MLAAGPTMFAENAPPRPDILLVVADDLGFSDVGAYGGEIDTPNLDRLAAEGLRFSRFRVQPMCVTSRISLLAGVPLEGGANQEYTRTVAFPALLREAGYTTSMVGKWHAGTPDARDPALFDRYFGFLTGMTDSFVGGPDWWENKQPFQRFDEGFYSTHAFTDRAIEWIRAHGDDPRPHFLFVSHNAPHHPCQAPRATVEKYLHRYAAGYDAIRAERVRRQAESALFETRWAPAQPGAEVIPWNELTDARKEAEIGKMAAYAATVDEIDQQLGRLLDAVEASGRADNTLVIFLSDNGADYGNGSRVTDTDHIAWEPQANPTSSNGWAWVKNTPFRSYKHSAFEGGIASPLLVRWPAGIGDFAGSTVHQTAHITDFVPTFLELTGTRHPAQAADSGMEPLSGTSLVPLLSPGGERPAPPQFTWYSTTQALVKDGFKAVRLYASPWQLYDLHADRAETNDLAAEQPERLRALVDLWNQQAAPSVRVSVERAIETAGPTGWGQHRLGLATGDSLVAVVPANGEQATGPVRSLSLEFNAPITFPANSRPTIRLFSASQEIPLWEARLAAGKLGADGKTVVFRDLPTLAPDAAHFVEWDAGWAIVGGRKLGPLNDGAYWWRFRTASPAHSDADSDTDTDADADTN